MTLTQLGYFLRIGELKSLSKAASALRIAQPALSRQVRNLETELGSDLLVRHPWGVTLTPAGEVLFERARRLLRDVEATRDAVRALSKDPTGRVALGVPSSLATALLPPLAERLARNYPGIRPHFVDGFSAVLHGRTIGGDLDLAILYDDRELGPLSAAPLLTETLVLVGAAGARVAATRTAEMLEGRQMILPARPNRLRLIIDGVLSGDAPVIEVDSLAAIVAMVRQGRGFTVLPYSAVRDDVAAGSLKTWDLRLPQVSRTLVLVRLFERQPTPATMAVEAEIRSLVASLADELSWKALKS